MTSSGPTSTYLDPDAPVRLGVGDRALQRADQLRPVLLRLLEEHPDGYEGEELLTAGTVRGWSREQARDARLDLELELEARGVISRDRVIGAPWRTRRSGDPDPAPLEVIAEDVLGLQWPNPRYPAGGRTIEEAHVELADAGRLYRHVDVYAAMHRLLKGRELRLTGQKWWTLNTLEAELRQRTALIPDDPVERAAAEERLEADLVAAYVRTLGGDVRKEHRVRGCKIDVWQPKARRVIEAKAHADVTTCGHAYAQVVMYRHLLGLDDVDVDAIAVLLPRAPEGDARGFLEALADDCYGVELVYPRGDGFVIEKLG